MALVNCHECKNQVSDTARTCPHCGYELIGESPKMEVETKTQEASVATAVAVAADPAKKKKVHLVIPALCIIVIAAIIGFAVHQSNVKAQKEAEIKAYNTYIVNLETVSLAMLSNGAKCEELYNLIHAVWSDTIQNEFDLDTSKYTSKSKDFNESLGKLFAAESTQDSIKAINVADDEIKGLMKELQSPTEEFKVCYNTLTQMYSEYNKLVSLVTSPTGSLISYTQEFSQSDSEFLSAYHNLDLQIPEAISVNNESGSTISSESSAA